MHTGDDLHCDRLLCSSVFHLGNGMCILFRLEHSGGFPWLEFRSERNNVCMDLTFNNNQVSTMNLTLMRKLALSLCLLSFSLSATARDEDKRGYFGLSAGIAGVDLSQKDPVLSANGSATGLQYTLFGGYRVSQNFAFEASYVSTGALELIEGSDSTASQLLFTGKLGGQLGDSIRIWGKGGAGYSYYTQDYDYVAQAVSDKTTSWDGIAFVAGIGADFIVHRNVVFTTEFDYMLTTVNALQRGTNINLELKKWSYTVGMQFEF
ncbi:Uncharacterised protein [BD1-7 clade bacterium]|uniref:Outer membrane protein beta-barrel domain-containing protein n=1 Tax=BD1-7 clade bacterium TaxID=2029982 RepID=A0A5S9Q349_9GAMM|nr:Uncharacterised protein [BD1-7 clade bacterium]CAA0112001.1 Uncharacterised protein [BD1-7 clade bacterium]